MHTEMDVTKAANRLAAAWRDGRRLDALPQGERPGTLEQAYALQARFVALTGAGTAGWKIAGASPRGLREDAPTTPALGRLLKTSMYDSGATLRLPAGATFTLEVEAAVVFARDVAPAREAFDPATMIADAMVAVEVVCSRFVDRKAVGFPSFVADNAAFHAFVRGDALPGGAASAWLAAPAALYRDGVAVAAALTGDARTDPLLALAHLWQVFAANGTTIAAGETVTTGTLTVPLDTDTPGEYEARLGEASLRFTVSR
ncbi:fumarylacetoacetate hydrolase family protein [Cupriavidus respiraculi]|uniref:2-keto-4-pentenoate hydratase n=1 Tax=Cupriavidus respiraculi TaxID=195930 RepID=UPI001C9476B1|nr:fumarylacetoacetate hydrolase family protein [Cupriavidus respiraculi]MBY4948662.1 fumarylacetoacetate hydrolase family protein [Cupriavidus respiraculi]